MSDTLAIAGADVAESGRRQGRDRFARRPKLAPKDKIEIKGSRIMCQGEPAIIAAEIHKGAEVLMLRDANGIPMRAGWRRSQ